MSGAYAWHQAKQCFLDLSYRVLPLETGITVTGIEVHTARWLPGTTLTFLLNEAVPIALPAHTDPRVGHNIKLLQASGVGDVQRFLMLPSSSNSAGSFYFMSPSSSLSVVSATCTLPL